MDIIVCIKQVPGTTSVEVDPVTGVLKRDGIESIINPYDLYSIELALRMREKYGGTVRVVTMGPPQAKAVVLEAIFMGADSGYVISDRKFAGSDVLATSYTLSQFIQSLDRYDLILCGKQTTDGDTAQVGAELAEFLGIPHISYVSEIHETAENKLTVCVQLDGRVITQRVKLPCLICADADINTPRLPSYKRKRSLKNENIGLVSLKDFMDADETHYGLTGSPTQVERIFPPENNAVRQILEGGSTTLADALHDLLKMKKFI